MRAFLHHVLNDLIIDQYRKRKVTSLDVLIEKGFEPMIDQSKQLFNMLDGKRAVRWINSLPEKYQKVMNMRFLEGRSFAEISALTHQTKNAIRVQMHRGIQKLKMLHSAIESDLSDL